MINRDTLRLLQVANELSELLENGIDDFKNATPETIDKKVFYDGQHPDENGDIMAYGIVVHAVFNVHV